MRRRVFILAIDSYLLRKGMLYLVKQAEASAMVEEFWEVQAFIKHKHGAREEFIIISHAMFIEASAIFRKHPELLDKTLLLDDWSAEQKPAVKKQPAYACIHPEEGKTSILEKIRGLIQSREDEEEQESALSPREKTILREVSMGQTNKQIADRLFLSTHTVMSHRKNISAKLGIKSVSGLTIYAIVNNIITIEELSSNPA